MFYEFERIAAPVLLMIGDKDTTAIGKNLAPPAIRPTLGNYPVLAKEAASRFPHAHLVEFPELGHAPQIQAPDVFHKALLDNIPGSLSGDLLINNRLYRKKLNNIKDCKFGFHGKSPEQPRLLVG